MTRSERFTFLTQEYNEMILITDRIEQAVSSSRLRSGMVTVMTLHTTTGIAVNEALECLQSDIDQFLSRLVPEDFPYAHARMLADYGSTAGNPTGHLKAHLTGNHCHFPVEDGAMIRGGAQEVFFCEFDGPAERSFLVLMEGDFDEA